MVPSRYAPLMPVNGNHRTQPVPMPAPAYGIVLAIAAIALGALFFLNNLGLAGFHDVARFWPALPIAVGFVLLVDSRTTPTSVSGGLLVAAAALVQLANLHLVVLDWRAFWPAFPVAAGVLSLLWLQPWRDQRPVLHR